PAGRIDREHLVSALDVLPTICDYAGIEGPAVMRGRSMREIIEKPHQPGHEYVVSEMAFKGWERSFMLRTNRYKYMVFPRPRGERIEMFFDMQTDPGEMKNLAGQTEYAAEIERHRKMLKEWNELTAEDKYPIRPAPKRKKPARHRKK
ncbi:MAG: sulfatase/phosphatase domain-containing protein, partial [Planctomycetota bacterium]